MMQRTGAGPLTRQVLVVDGGLAEPTGTAARSVRALVTELRARNVDVLEAVSYEDGLATVVSDAGIHCILVDWTRSSDDSAAREQATELLRAVRARNAKVPIFLMASRKLAGSVSVETATLADEYIWILADTAPFIAGRVQAAIERYLEALLPHRRSIELEGAAIDEERRLCYVGITRAQDRLTISLALGRMKWGKPRASKPSRFLFEITGQGDSPRPRRPTSRPKATAQQGASRPAAKPSRPRLI